MKFILNVLSWILIGAACAFLAGLVLAIFVPPPPLPDGTKVTDGPFLLACKASVQGGVIGFFVGLFGPRLYGPAL